MKNLGLLLLLLCPMWVWGQDVEQDSTKQIVQIDFADWLEFIQEDGNSITQLIGNVELHQDSSFMYADTAMIKNEVDVFATGNILIQQGDSLSIFADSLFYNSETKLADLYGNVILQRGEQRLFTTHLNYDMENKLGTYSNRALLVNGETQLTSKRGYYYTDTHQVFFKDSVAIVDTNFVLKADTLLFNTESRMTTFLGPTLISNDSSRVYCEGGFYDIANEVAQFTDNAQFFNGEHRGRGDTITYEGNLDVFRINGHARYQRKDQEAIADIITYDQQKDAIELHGKALVQEKEQILQANSVNFDDETGMAIAKGGVIWQDTSSHVTIVCETANYEQETGYLEAMGGKNGDRPLLITVLDGDSLFMRADTLVSLKEDSLVDSRKLLAYRDVRLFKSDLQGICDSLSYSSTDSLFHLYNNPMLWTDTTQFVADTIDVQLANNSIDKIFLKDKAFIINSPDELYFNQMQGKNITAFFREGEIHSMYINGNAKTIYYALDEKNAYVGVNETACSEMKVSFGSNQVTDILFLSQPSGTFHPMTQVNHNKLKLDGFRWETKKRPKGLADL